MKQIVLIIAGIYGLLSIVFGAFGAHALKKILDSSKLESFEVGVRYQMYHAIVLLVIGFWFQFNSGLEKATACLLIIGTFLFSFSIYLLSFSNHWNVPTKILGPITPIGGLLMILGWLFLIFSILKRH